MTFKERLRNLCGELVGEAFVSDLYNLDGEGPREVQKLADAFEQKILNFMVSERNRPLVPTR